jgi:cell wall-associated NlpC family hydrolase
MKGYFEDVVRRIYLLEQAEAWHGTPFIPHAKVKGAGVDCVHLCAEIYIACGALKKFDPPNYTIDGGSHCKESKVLQWVLESGRFIEVTEKGIGDLVCFKMWKGVEHHVGIVLNETTFLHAERDIGVHYSNLDDSTWSLRLRKIYRPVEVAA